MRKILDEVYMTVNAETETDWIIQFSSQIYKEKCGFFKTPKLFNENEKHMYWVGAAHYMFIFEENDGRTGTLISLLEDGLFASGMDEKRKCRKDELRARILNENELLTATKI